MIINIYSRLFDNLIFFSENETAQFLLNFEEGFHNYFYYNLERN